MKDSVTICETMKWVFGTTVFGGFFQPPQNHFGHVRKNKCRLFTTIYVRPKKIEMGHLPNVPYKTRVLRRGAMHFSRVPKWPSSVAYTIFFAKYVLNKCFEYL